MTMKNGLKNIILHHSYFKNKRCVIACDGHTNNTGANGAGKTSALQLIPVFYGYPPEKIMSKDAGKLSFLDYYLPHTHSFIAFEYQNFNGYQCAVLYRHSKNAKLMYRFIKGRADDSLFSDVTLEHFEKGLPTADLFKLLGQQGFLISHAIDVIMDYKAVISYDKKRLHKNKLTYDAQEFCLNDPKKPMNHIGELTAVLLNSNQLLFKLREMLSSIVIGQDSLGVKPNLINSDKLVSTILSLQKINKQRAKLEKAVDCHHQLLQSYAVIKQHQRQSLVYADQFLCQDNEYRQDKKHQENYWQEQVQSFELSRDVLNAKISQVKSEKEQKQRQLDELSKKYNHYLNNDIQTKSQEVKNLPIYYERLTEAERYYDKLNGGLLQLKETYEQECRKIEQVYEAQKEQFTQQIFDIQELINHHHHKTQQALDKVIVNKNNSLEALKNEQQQIENELFAQVSQSLANIDVVSYLTDDEKVQKDTYDHKMATLHDTINHQHRQHQEAQKLYEQAKKQCHHLMEDYHQLEKQLSAEKLKQKEYLTLIHRSGTLLDFLNSHEYDWQDTIGKLINPKLLLRTDLSPEWDRENVMTAMSSLSFYGLHLQTETIELPWQAKNQEQMLQQLDELNLGIGQKQQQLDELDKQLKKAQEHQKNCHHDEQLVKQRLDTALNELQVHQEMLFALNEQHHKNAQLRKEQAQAHYEALKREYDAVVIEHQKRYKQKEAEFDKRVAQIKEESEQEKAQYQSQIDDCKHQKKNCDDQKVNKLKHQEVVYQKALVNEGVDETTLALAKQEVNIAEQRYKKVKSYKTLVDEYRRWCDYEYSQKDVWQDELYEHKEHHERLRDEKTALEKSYTDKQAQHKRQIDEIEQKIQRLSSQKQTLEQLCKRCDELFDGLDNGWLNMVQTVAEPVSFEWFVRQVNDELDRHTKLFGELKTAYATISNTLQDGDIAQAWSERMERYRHVFGSAGYYLGAMRELDAMLSQDIPQKIGASIEEFRTTAHEMQAYHHKIKHFNQQVKALSDKLTGQINHEHQFRALSDIRIQLSSALAQDDMYRSLKNFCWQYENVGEMNTLPSEGLFDEFCRALALLNHHQIDTTKTATLIELEILCTEQGRPFRLTHHNDLTKASSTGISTILVVVLFASLTRYLCHDETLAIHWPLDEIGRIDNKNTEDLFAFMNRQNIYLFCAEPELNPIKSKHFTCKNDIDRVEGIRRYQKVSRNDNPLLN